MYGFGSWVHSLHGWVGKGEFIATHSTFGEVLGGHWHFLIRLSLYCTYIIPQYNPCVKCELVFIYSRLGAVLNVNFVSLLSDSA